MRLFRVFIFLPLFLLWSCGPATHVYMTKTLPPLDYDVELVVLDIGEPIPEGARKIGEIEVGDTGFSVNCSYTVVLDKLKIEARKQGAQMIQIYEHKRPDIWSSCHRLKAYVLEV